MSAVPLKDSPPWRRVIITGAAHGLGRALTERCAAAGMAVGMIDCDAEALAHARDAVHTRGGSAAAAVCDVGRGEEVAAAFTALRAALGPPDAVICCAAVGDSAWKMAFHAARLQRVLEVNVLGIAHCMEHGLPLMQTAGGGTFVMISSLLDARGYAGTASYSASKAALRAIADSARVLLRDRGVRVVLVRPGFMRTAMTAGNAIAMPGMVTADDAALRILRGVARGKSVIAFPRWLAVLAECARFFPRPVYDAIVRYALKHDGEEEALRYHAVPRGEVSHGNA